MDIVNALQDLYAAGQRLEHIISTLQGLQQKETTTQPPWRGPMGWLSAIP
jgi:hypothetical protein